MPRLFPCSLAESTLELAGGEGWASRSLSSYLAEDGGMVPTAPSLYNLLGQDSSARCVLEVQFRVFVEGEVADAR